MFKRCLSLMLSLVLLVSVSGCGTLFTGSTEMVNINSTPNKAKVHVNGGYMGTTPVTLSLQKDRDYIILVKKEGYEDATATLTRRFNATSILNLISILCWVVDVVTGGLWKFERNNITVDLEQVPVKKAGFSIGEPRFVLAP